MDRKEFLKSCVSGLCACAAATLPAAAATTKTAPPPEDWRIGFVQKRYAKLVHILSAKMEDSTLSQTFEELGAFCASQQDDKLKAYAGKPDEFCKFITQGNFSATHDKASDTYTVVFAPERVDCFCPLASRNAQTPTKVCECSAGWQSHTWTSILGKPPKVALKETVLRGGKTCTFVITPT